MNTISIVMCVVSLFVGVMLGLTIGTMIGLYQDSNKQFREALREIAELRAQLTEKHGPDATGELSLKSSTPTKFVGEKQIFYNPMNTEFQNHMRLGLSIDNGEDSHSQAEPPRKGKP